MIIKTPQNGSVKMISSTIRYYRKANNLSQDELAEKLGVSRQSVSLWENGQTQPTIDNIIALAKIFNISTDSLLSSESALENSDSTLVLTEDSLEELPQNASTKSRKKKVWLAAAIAATAVIVIAALSGRYIHNNTDQPASGIDADLSPESKNHPIKETQNPADSQAASNGDDAASGSSTADGTTAEPAANNAGSISTAGGDIAEPSAGTVISAPAEGGPDSEPSTGAPIAQPSIDTPAISGSDTDNATSNSESPEEFDLFSYCKDFAIQRGQVNGDYSIYQQPATDYGGYDNEYFSISYWGGQQYGGILSALPP